ncbi:hypothetical protein I6G37_09280 [Serratia rubidaea]|uniref:hypothetical protein n=1 Tax=Serratia rubidaea TaxID=61652 RepID=UPI0018D8D0C1|nr:hypothetical protein [Serratia rubidaea]MCR0998779.1 hypothetical protein [Serratia rubidaea]QPT15117.1 hypothetical protein I6G37_09280 [Serratia rubidaea]
MSKRSDIIEPPAEFGKKIGLIYTEVLGWIDLGHALGHDIQTLLAQFQQGERSKAKYYLVTYAQNMSVRPLSTGRYIRWNIKRGRTPDEIHSIMLAMLMRTAYLFESWQAQPWFSWYTDSGFSGEDLVSDLLGFYHIIYPADYMRLIKPVSKNAALRRWDFYGAVGSYKNKSFKPILFPDPLSKGIAHRPHQAELPHFMRIVTPFNCFDSDVVRVIDNASIHVGVGG